MNSIRVFAPATVSNVSCGFDVLGFAMDGPGDEVQLTLTSDQEIKIRSILPASVKLPMSVEKNTAGVAVKSLLSAIGSKQGVDIELAKNLPLGSGMGSSGASAAAALVAINELLGNPLSRNELIPHAMEAERIACGSAHADNVAPSILGGFVLVREYDPLDVISIPIKAKLWCSLVHPHIELKTKDSRKVLKPQILLTDAVKQTGNIAALMIGLMKPDSDLISKSLQDAIAEPWRAKFIPGFDEIKKVAAAHGALGSGISGSGPSIYALSETKVIAQKVGDQIQAIFRKNKINSEVYVSAISDQGAH
ncbi:MAG TPA: homoserine kinase, partial [Cyclobacteriaceae bacterium]